MIRQSNDVIIGSSTEPIAAWMHLCTARAECGRSQLRDSDAGEKDIESIEKKENLKFDWLDKLWKNCKSIERKKRETRTYVILASKTNKSQ